MTRYCTKLTAKAELLKPNSDKFKVLASSLKDAYYGLDLKPQMDLLYVSACLVSAGESVGVNDNDDIFTREEAWAARHTPVIKPFNWEHKDKDIVGVIYTVQARSLDGETLDINNDKVPDCDFDLFVEAAIFRLIHPERAEEIQTRAAAGELYVSMEAWFDDYEYGLFNQKDHSLARTVARTEKTSFLDQHLRANRGTGVYRDPENDQDMRIGRVLNRITFGGCGFVGRPANKRSKIEETHVMNPLAEQDNESQVEKLLRMVLDAQITEEATLMNTQAGFKPEEVSAAVGSELDRRERAAAEAKAKQDLENRAKAAEARNQELEAEVNALTEAKEAREAENKALQDQIAEYDQVVDKLVQEQTAAGATSSTPPEIAKIDSASDGASAFNAKIAWLSQSRATLVERAARADELEAELVEAERAVREQDVRELLGGVFASETVEAMVKTAAKLDGEAYQEWRDEKELMVYEMAIAADKMKDLSDEEVEKLKLKKKKEKSESRNLFAALLEKRRSESGMADPDTMRNNPNEPTLINHPGNGETDVRSGVNPGVLRTPIHKIAGSAGNDPSQVLDDVDPVSGLSLAGSQAGGNGEDVNGFRSLASLVVDVAEKEVRAEKPGFDPVQ